MWQGLRWNTLTSITYLDDSSCLPFLVCHEFHATIGGSKLQCVIHHVEQYLLQPVAIRAYKWSILGYLFANLLAMSELLRLIVHLVNNCTYVDSIFTQYHLSLVKSRQSKEVFNESMHALDLSVHVTRKTA